MRSTGELSPCSTISFAVDLSSILELMPISSVIMSVSLLGKSINESHVGLCLGTSKMLRGKYSMIDMVHINPPFGIVNCEAWSFSTS